MGSYCQPQCHGEIASEASDSEDVRYLSGTSRMRLFTFILAFNLDGVCNFGGVPGGGSDTIWLHFPYNKIEVFTRLCQEPLYNSYASAS